MTLFHVNTENFFILTPLGNKYDHVEEISSIAQFLIDYNSSNLFKGLVLSGNSYSSVVVNEFVNILLRKEDGFCSEIRYLDFSDMFTSRLKDDVPKSLEALGRLIQHCPVLVTLNLSDNAFGPVGANAISPFLEKVSLNSLFVNNNGLGQVGGVVLINALRPMKNLHTFSMGRNRLEDAGAYSIAELIATTLSSSLRQFSVFQNGITKKGIIALCQALSACTNIEILDLQDNTFTEDAAIFFANNVIPAISSTVRILSLNDCLLTKKGSRVILEKMIEAEQPFPNLTVLGLTYNGIGAAELSLVTRLVASTPHLQALQLNGNAFDSEDPSCIALREALMRMNQEDILDSLSDMEVESEEEESIEESKSKGEIAAEFRQESPDTCQLADILEHIHV